MTAAPTVQATPVTDTMIAAARQALASTPAPSGLSPALWQELVADFPLTDAIAAAIQADTPAHAGGVPLTTPCHGEPLRIYTRDDGQRDVPDEIACPRDRCLNSWNPDGTVIHLSLPDAFGP